MIHLSDVFDLYFELSNEDRVNILKLLQKTHLNLTNISNTLELRNQETSRHLTRLEETGLIARNTDGSYQTTHYAELVLRKQREIEFLVKYRDYFNRHKLTRVPDELVSTIGVLGNAEFIDDVMVVMQNMQRVIDESEEYLWRITDQFMLILLDHFVAATDRGVEYRQLYPKDIKLPPDAESTVKMRKARREGLFKTHTHDNIQVFMMLSEKEVGVLSFPTFEDRFDYVGFTSTDSKVLDWCKELFMSYWKDRLPPISGLWDNIP